MYATDPSFAAELVRQHRVIRETQATDQRRARSLGGDRSVSSTSRRARRRCVQAIVPGHRLVTA